uniref:ZP domain-containing protein n=1 Tax=Rhabditophanes sp. KR3021 TaxID=114890 RepID=A0AC35U6E0_9BILA
MNTHFVYALISFFFKLAVAKSFRGDLALDINTGYHKISQCNKTLNSDQHIITLSGEESYEKTCVISLVAISDIYHVKVLFEGFDETMCTKSYYGNVFIVETVNSQKTVDNICDFGHRKFVSNGSNMDVIYKSLNSPIFMHVTFDLFTLECGQTIQYFHLNKALTIRRMSYNTDNFCKIFLPANLNVRFLDLNLVPKTKSSFVYITEGKMKLEILQKGPGFHYESIFDDSEKNHIYKIGHRGGELMLSYALDNFDLNGNKIKEQTSFIVTRNKPY